MPSTFQYQALDSNGRTHRGRLIAAHERAVLRQLQGQGLTPVAIDPVDAAVARPSRGISLGQPKFQDYILSLKQLSLLLNAGVPLVQAVTTLKEQGIHPVLGAAFAEIEKRIRAGDPFSEAFATAFPGLPAYVSQLVVAGEAIGRLSASIADAVKQMEYEHQVRTDVKNALTYPSVLIAAGCSAVLFIFVVVVPRFAPMLASSKTELPFISVAVFKAGLFLNDNLTLILILLAMLIAGAVLLWRDPAVKVRARDQLAKAPLVGTWLREADIANWASMLSTMLANGISLIKALELARDSLSLRSLANRLGQVTKLVRSGQSLSGALASQDVFDQTAISLVQVGEESGELAGMLRSLATLYEEAGRQRMKRFLLLLEPAAIIFIGGVIGGVITAIMLAITSVNQIAL